MRFLWSFWEQEALESEGGEQGRAVGQSVPDGLVDELPQGKRTPLKIGASAVVLHFKKSYTKISTICCSFFYLF